MLTLNVIFDDGSQYRYVIRQDDPIVATIQSIVCMEGCTAIEIVGYGVHL